jgi:hypothetical protein
VIDRWYEFEMVIDLDMPERLPALADFVISLSGDTNSESSEKVELRAAALAILVRLDPTYLVAARQAVGAAERSGSAGWPNLHLGESLVLIGQYAEGLERLQRIPTGYFEVRGLLWRAVRVKELQAIANLALGRDHETLVMTEEIAAELAARGDEDDLASPYELVTALLERAEAGGSDSVRQALVVIAASIDVVEWLRPQLAKRLLEFLHPLGHGEDLIEPAELYILRLVEKYPGLQDVLDAHLEHNVRIDTTIFSSPIFENG